MSHFNINLPVGETDNKAPNTNDKPVKNWTRPRIEEEKLTLVKDSILAATTSKTPIREIPEGTLVKIDYPAGDLAQDDDLTWLVLVSFAKIVYDVHINALAGLRLALSGTLMKIRKLKHTAELNESSFHQTLKSFLIANPDFDLWGAGFKVVTQMPIANVHSVGATDLVQRVVHQNDCYTGYSAWRDDVALIPPVSESSREAFNQAHFVAREKLRKTALLPGVTMKTAMTVPVFELVK